MKPIFTFPQPRRRLAEQFFHLKTEKPVQTNGATAYNIGLNGTPLTVQELNNLPVTTINGGTIFVHDVANVRDGFAVQQNVVRQDGQ